MILLLASAGCLALLAAQAAPADPPLRIGETVRRALDPPAEPGIASSAFFLVAESTGTLTILLESHDFDASLRVEGEGGEVLGEDDDGGIETNARLVLEASERSRYRVVALAAKGGSGEFALSIVLGEAPVPAGGALLDAAIAFRAAAAERALARGDLETAADSRMAEGKHRVSRSQFREATVALEAALALFRRSGERSKEARALGNLGAARYFLGEHAAAEEVHRESLALARDTGDRSVEAQAYCNLGIVYQRRGEYSRARESHELHLALAREIGDRGGESRALGNLGVVHQSLGDPSRAREYLELHLALCRELGDRAGEATALGSLGNASLAIGDPATAREYHERHLELAREVGDRAGEARALGNLGEVYDHLGEYAKAREHHHRHLDLARELGYRAEVARALLHLGDVAWALGEFDEARERYEDSLALYRELGHREGEMVALGNLGNVFQSIGDPANAQERYERVLVLARESGNRSAEAIVLGNLAIAQRQFENYARARALDLDSLALARRLGDRVGEATALGGLALTSDHLRDYAEAREYYEEALAIYRDIGDRSGEARTLDNLAAVHLASGDGETAARLARTALDLHGTLGVESRTLYSLLTLTRVALADRDAAEALAWMGRAERVLEPWFPASAGSFDAAVGRSRFFPWGETAQDLAALRAEEAADPAARSQAIADGFREAGRWKGRTLLEGIAEHRSGGRTSEAIRLRRRTREAVAARDRSLERLSRAIRDQRPEEEVEGLRGEAEGLLAEMREIAREVAETSPRDAALDLPRGTDPDEVRRVLGPKTALVEFAEGEERLYAYVLTDRDLAHLDLGDRAALQGDVEEYLSLIGSLEPAVPPREIGAAGAALFDRLLGPALREGRESLERLVVVPTAALAGLPFEALVMSGSGDRFADLGFVGDRYELCYAPSSPVLVELATLGRHGGEDRVLVLADPVYPSETGVVASGESVEGRRFPDVLSMRAMPDPTRLPRLSKTRKEALALSSLLLGPEEERVAGALGRLSGERSGTLSTRRVDLHLGTEASRLRLEDDLRDYSVLHLAAHGYVDREFPQRTGLALSFGEGEEGIFTIADALELDLDAELVVLSACETARGEVKAGEGVESMARAFLYAGARGVVASLWRVEERAAVETMEVFYRGALKEGLSPSRALREAKSALRRSNEKRGLWGASGRGAVESGHPFFWAPFLYIGLPR